MGDTFNLLTLKKTSLSELFAKQEFKNSLNIQFAESAQDLIASISDQIPDIIVVDQDTALENGAQFVNQLKEQIVLHNALNDSIALIPPVLVMQNHISDFDIQQEIYDCGAFESLPFEMDTKRLAAKLRHMAARFVEEQHRIFISTNQQRDTIKTLVQINKKTGVFNKQTFIYKTQTVLKNNPEKKFILIMMNLDRFKVFNDLFGFDEGDKILEKIGVYLNNHSEDFATYGHIYADHFVACIESSTFNQKEFLQHFDACVKKLHKNFDFVIRFGIYEFKNPDDDVSLACDRAEMALGSIKQDFTERFASYSDSMIQNLKEEQELISDMVAGIQNREFKVYLQPQFDYTTESLIGAEALVRWIHPVKGLISPALFIPVFERNGFITQLDEYIWEETCRLMRKWLDEGLNPVPVSVNISRRDIYNHDLVAIFDGLLAKYNLTPKNLRLEITESAYMDNPSQLIQVVDSLRNRGFCLEMDDFGSGYSSLNTLKEVPVDILKLDMKFIASGTTKSYDKDGKEDTRGGSILSSVVRMANWLHLPVIAEGIESKEQADYLKSIGCFHMQGFYFAKPMPSDQYEKILSELNPVFVESDKADDTTDAAKFLDATTQSTLLFNSFVGGAAIIEWTGDDVEVLRMNDQYLEELGASQEDYSGFKKNFLSSIDEKSRNIFMTSIAEVTKSGKSTFCEVLLKSCYKENPPFWVRIHLRHLGKTITSDIYYMSVENIDFRMQLLQLNTNLSEQLSSIMENVPCGILNVTLGDKIQSAYSNETAANMLGYTSTEFRVIANENPFLVFHKKDLDGVRQCVYAAVSDNQKTFNRKARVICKDGSIKKVQFAGTIIKQTDGTIMINIIFVDIDEQEKQLVKGYTDIMLSIFNEVFEIDFEGNTSHTVKSDFMQDFKTVLRPLDETLKNWVKKMVISEDKAAVSEFLNEKHLEEAFRSGEKSPSIEYSVMDSKGVLRKIRTLVIKMPVETSTYLICNSTLKD